MNGCTYEHSFIYDLSTDLCVSVTRQYDGPAGLFFSPDEILLIWSALNLLPTGENAEIRARVKRFLEQRGGNGQEPVKGTVATPS